MSITATGRVLWTTGAMCVLALVAILMAKLLLGPTRASQIQQCKLLVGNIALQIDDLYLYPEHHRLNGGPDRDVLRVRCRYIGGDPNHHHHLWGALFAASNGPVLDDSGGYGQFAADYAGGEGIPIMWEFWKSPPFGSKFVMRIYVDTSFPLSAKTPQRYVDFPLTCLPRLTPHGESYLP